MPFEVEMKLEDAAVEGSLEAVTLWHLPLLVHNGESYVFIGDSGTETNSERVGGAIWLQKELRRASLVSQVRVEDVELVSLHNFRRWILRIIVGLIVLVPLIALLDTVEETRFAHDK